MRYLLKYDGWAFDPGLPHNWMYKFSANKLIFRDEVHQFIKCEGGTNAEEDMKKVQCFNVSRSRGKKVRREAEKSFDETDSSSSKYSVEESEGSTELSGLEESETD